MITTFIILIVLIVLLALVLGPKHRGASQVVRDMFPGGRVKMTDVSYTSKTKRGECMELRCSKLRQHCSRRCVKHSLAANI